MCRVLAAATAAIKNASSAGATTAEAEAEAEATLWPQRRKHGQHSCAPSHFKAGRLGHTRYT